MRGRTAGRAWALTGGAAALALLTATGAHAEGRGDIRVVKTVVDGGGNVIVGTSKKITFPIALTVKDDSGVKGVSDADTYDTAHGWGFFERTGTSCARKSHTTSVCTVTMTVDPSWIRDSDDMDSNKLAGVWQVDATVKANDGDYWISDRIAEYKVKRASRLTADAAPEPVAKGAGLTVTGRLTRADWEDLRYHGFTGQEVKLQFKADGAAGYRTVRTVRTGDAGKLRAKVTATAAGSWRWYFPGTTTTARVVSAGDPVKLR
ncbi:hypothetical protein [Streptomyces sp. NPDC006193]|uniref:hypothetical protein n=1 Tax=Streptomyces sp. NPDC006193 TaxID=3155717 RepID=UPI0033A82AEE